jgi:hypothetical protein
MGEPAPLGQGPLIWHPSFASSRLFFRRGDFAYDGMMER